MHGYGAQESKRCTCGRAGRRTFAAVVALAVEEDPPSPAARLGPIHWMGRAVRSKALQPRGSKSNMLCSLKLPDTLVSNLATTVTMVCVSLACDNGEGRRRQGPGLQRVRC